MSILHRLPELLLLNRRLVWLGIGGKFFQIVHCLVSDEVQLAVEHRFHQYLVKSTSGALSEQALSLPLWPVAVLSVRLVRCN